MRTFKQQDGLGFAIALCVLLFALTFRALMPAGYMLEAQARGVELVLCGSGGLQTVIVDADDRPVDKPDHPEDRKANAACVFTGVAAIAPDEAPSPLRSVIAEGASAQSQLSLQPRSVKAWLAEMLP